MVKRSEVFLSLDLKEDQRQATLRDPVQGLGQVKDSGFTRVHPLQVSAESYFRQRAWNPDVRFKAWGMCWQRDSTGSVRMIRDVGCL